MSLFINVNFKTLDISKINKKLANYMGLPTEPEYRDTGRLDDNGKSILEGSIIIADGYGSNETTHYCVVYDEDESTFGSCAYRDFEPLSWYNNIIIKGHVEDYRLLYENHKYWDKYGGNLGEALKEIPYPKYDKSWNALMEVIEKIRDKGHVRVILDGDITIIKPYEKITVSNFKKIEVLENGSFKSAYKAVEAYIDWYNSQ